MSKYRIKSEFTRAIIALMTGTSLSQAILVLSSLLLAKIYTPDTFGAFAAFTATVTLAAVFVTGRYELAILLPENDKTAAEIYILTCALSAACTSLIATVAFVFFFLNPAGTISSIKYQLPFIPIAIFSQVMLQLNITWMNRRKKYKKISRTRITQSMLTTVLSITFGIFQSRFNGLIFGWTAGIIISLLIASKATISEIAPYARTISMLRLRKLALEYKDFPKYDLISTGINTITHQAPSLLFSSIFSPAVAGYYFMTQRCISLPLQIIGGSFAEAFRAHAADMYRAKGRCDSLVKKSSFLLFLISTSAGAIILLFSNSIFNIAFGKDWAVSAEIAKIMVPMFIARFIASPTSYMFYIAGKQRWDMIGHIGILLVLISAFYIGWRLNSYIATMWILSIGMMFAYFGYWLTSIQLSKGRWK